MHIVVHPCFRLPKVGDKKMRIFGLALDDLAPDPFLRALSLPPDSHICDCDFIVILDTLSGFRIYKMINTYAYKITQ